MRVIILISYFISNTIEEKVLYKEIYNNIFPKEILYTQYFNLSLIRQIIDMINDKIQNNFLWNNKMIKVTETYVRWKSAATTPTQITLWYDDITSISSAGVSQEEINIRNRDPGSRLFRIPFLVYHIMLQTKIKDGNYYIYFNNKQERDFIYEQIIEMKNKNIKK